MSRPGELHPQPLVERDVNPSAHTAPIRRTRLSSRSASVQDDPWRADPAAQLRQRVRLPLGQRYVPDHARPRICRPALGRLPPDPGSRRIRAAEETDHPREVIEAALARVVENKVEAAYARSDLFERVRQLMDDWAAYVNGDLRAIRTVTARHHEGRLWPARGNTCDGSRLAGWPNVA